MDKIQRWLDGERAWDEGFKLFFLFGKNVFLRKVFESTGETKQNKIRLAEELEALVKSPEKLVAENLPVKSPMQDAGYFTDIEYAKLPAAIKQMKDETVELMNQRTYLKGRLRDSISVAERYEAAKQIMRLGVGIKNGWAALDYYKEHGKLPTDNEDYTNLDGKDKVELILKRNANRSYISKYEDNPRKAEDVKRWRAENEEIQRRLVSVV